VRSGERETKFIAPDILSMNSAPDSFCSKETIFVFLIGPKPLRGDVFFLNGVNIKVFISNIKSLQKDFRL